MSSPKIIQQILSKPIQHLLLSRKRLPNIQVIRLYRQVYKLTGQFYWNNQKGRPWSQALRKSARKQFELSKNQTDPILIMKMIVTTRKCIQELQEKLFQGQAKLIANVEETRNEPGNEDRHRAVFRNSSNQ